MICKGAFPSPFVEEDHGVRCSDSICIYSEVS